MSIRMYRSLMKDEADVLTVKDVARILQIGKNKVYEMIHTGQLPAMKLGKKMIVPKTVLIEFLDDKSNYLKPEQRTQNKFNNSKKFNGIIINIDNMKSQKGVV